MRKIAQHPSQAIFVDGIERNLNPGAQALGRTAFPMILVYIPTMGAISLEGISCLE
jgi:hypothetical protein